MTVNSKHFCRINESVDLGECSQSVEQQQINQSLCVEETRKLEPVVVQAVARQKYQLRKKLLNRYTRGCGAGYSVRESSER